MRDRLPRCLESGPGAAAWDLYRRHRPSRAPWPRGWLTFLDPRTWPFWIDVSRMSTRQLLLGVHPEDLGDCMQAAEAHFWQTGVFGGCPFCGFPRRFEDIASEDARIYFAYLVQASAGHLPDGRRWDRPCPHFAAAARELLVRGWARRRWGLWGPLGPTLRGRTEIARILARPGAWACPPPSGQVSA